MSLTDSLNLKATAFANRWRLVIKIWLVFSFLSYALAYYLWLEVFGFISAISIFGCVCLLAFSSLLWFIASLVFCNLWYFYYLKNLMKALLVMR